MKKSSRIITSIFLAIATMITACMSLYVSAGSKQVNANKLMLDSILNERQWIVDTLVNGDYSTNPYTELCAGATRDTFFDSVISNYESDDILVVFVAAMQESENIPNYVQNLTDVGVNIWLTYFGLESPITLVEKIEETVKTAGSFKYEDVINAVLSEDYTSSWGTTLFEDNSSVESYRQMAKILKNVSKYQKALKDNASFLENNAGFETADAMYSYVNDFLNAYEDNLYDALVNQLGTNKIGGSEALNKKLIAASALATVMYLQTYAPPGATTSHLSEAYNQFFLEGTSQLLSDAGKVIKIGSAATEYAMLLETLSSQTDTTVDVMKRISYNTNNEPLRAALNTYAKLAKDSGNKLMYSYDSIIDYINKKGLVGEKVLDYSKKPFLEYLQNCSGYTAASENVMLSAICDNLLEMGACLKLGMFLVDGATNIKETSEKIYVCESIKRLIEETVKTYKIDYNIYTSNPTDTNAKRCLDDLDFLKKLRLYGEKQAYGCLKSNASSIVAELAGGCDAGLLAQHYQGTVDSLLGCTFSPNSNVDFTLNSGDVLNIYPYRTASGYLTYYGVLKKSNGATVTFPEAQMILNSSLVLNGGTLNIRQNATLSSSEVLIPCVNVKSTSTINIENSTLVIGGINNKSSLTLNANGENSKLEISSTVNNSGTLTLSGTSKNIVLGEVDGGSFVLKDVNAKINGNFTATGNVIFSGGSLEVTGDCNIVGSGNHRYLSMKNDSDCLLVDGNFTIGEYCNPTYSPDWLTAGTVEVKGDFTVKGKEGEAIGRNAYYETGVHKTILSGDKTQTVSVSGDNQFENLVLKNTSTDGVVFATAVKVTGLFNHNQNNFTLYDNGTGSSFPDYDKDGLKDNVDKYPLESIMQAADFTVSEIPDMLYTGSEIKPSISVMYGEKALEENKDYTLDYSNNTSTGTATVTITGIDHYTGTKEVNFTIYCVHDYEITRVEPTCTQNGSEHKVCKICGEDIVRMPVQDITVDSALYPESAHNYPNSFNHIYNFSYDSASKLVITFSQSTKTESGYDYIYLYDALGTQIGKYSGTSLAGKSFTIDGDSFSIKLTSDSSNTYYGFAFSSIVATVSDESAADLLALGHSLGSYTANNDATCTQDGTKTALCTVCNEVVTIIDEGSALGHNFKDYVYNNDADCTHNGTKTAKCTRCDETDTLEALDTATGHKHELDAAVEPTCTSSGKTEGSHCSVCGTVIVEQQTVPALGHSFGEWSMVKPSSITQKGIEICICDVCGEENARDIPVLEFNPDNVKDGFVYQINSVDDMTCTIISYTGDESQVIIPETIDGYTVIGIADYTFVYNDGIDEIIIPKSLTDIGNMAIGYVYNEDVQAMEKVENFTVCGYAESNSQEYANDRGFYFEALDETLPYPNPNSDISEALLGDVNGDGKVSVIDAKWILQSIAGTRTFDDKLKVIADVNKDGKITVIDAKWVLQSIAGTRVL